MPGGNNLERLRAEAAGPITCVSDWGAASSRGLVRAENEDAFGHLEPSLFVLADGMGGHHGGRMAARTAVQGVLTTAVDTVNRPLPELFRLAGSQVRLATRAEGFDTAGTTLVVVQVVNGVVTVASIGDSRVYRFRDRALAQLTSDHTVQNELASAGIDPRGLPKVGLHALTRFIGDADGNDVPDVTSLVPKVGDRLILATDGVFKQLNDTAMIAVMSQGGAHDAAAELVRLADQAGGRDNATAIVLHFGATQPAKAAT